LVLMALLFFALALFATRWPDYKLGWLNGVYPALPSVRSLPISWLSAGLQPNQTGALLATSCAFLFAVGFLPVEGGRPCLGPRWRLPARLLAVFGTALVFMTGSRAALAGLAVAGAFVLALRHPRWLLAPAGLAVAAALIALLWPGALDWTLDLLLHDETIDTKFMARLDIWSSAVRGTIDHAYTGIGLGVFNEVIPVRYPYETVALSYSVSQAHNVFLDTSLAVGIPGLIGLILLLTGVATLTAYALARPNGSRGVVAGLAASFIVFVVFGMTDSMSLSSPSSIPLWIWSGSLAIFLLRSYPPASRD